jgi:type VI secretion system protein ImpC
MSDHPFRIALVGNFSGRRTRPVPIEIDPDNFEEVMDRLGVAVELPAGTVPFRELDDFHPDHLYRHLPLFQSLQAAREEIARAKTVQVQPSPPPPAPPRPERPPVSSSVSLLDQIVEVSEPVSAPAVSARDEKARDEKARHEKAHDEQAWSDAIRKIGAAHAIPAADPRREELIAQIDRAAAEQMRAILHWPAFQSLEAAWRSLFLLFRHVETGVDLKIYLIDLTQDELFQDAASLARLFTDLPVGEDPWSLIVGLYTFSPRERDCQVLANLAAIARRAGAPFLSAIDARLFGCESIAATPDPDDWKRPLNDHDKRAWQQLRGSPDADWLGLAMPRFLLRLPYGKKTSPIESFAFEEMPDGPDHDAYLWGNPAVACACLLGQAFNLDGWDFRPGSVTRMVGLPIHTDPVREPTPPAEIWMSDRLAAAILDQGVMPLASIKHTDAAQLLRFQSIAGRVGEPRALAGPW